MEKSTMSPIWFFFVVIFSLASFGFSQQGGGDSLPCIQKLLPCQPYLKSPTAPPPPCCLPLKKLVAEESQCLCAVFTNPEILKSLNVTQQDGLNLAKSCGANADASICKKVVAPPAGSSKDPPSPSAPTDSPVTKSPPKSAGHSVGGSLTMAAMFGLITIQLF